MGGGAAYNVEVASSGRVGTGDKNYKRKKSQQLGQSKKHSKSSLNITMESMAAMSNIITPAAGAGLDESNDMLIKDFTLA